MYAGESGKMGCGIGKLKFLEGKEKISRVSWRVPEILFLYIVDANICVRVKRGGAVWAGRNSRKSEENS